MYAHVGCRLHRRIAVTLEWDKGYAMAMAPETMIVVICRHRRNSSVNFGGGQDIFTRKYTYKN